MSFKYFCGECGKEIGKEKIELRYGRSGFVTSEFFSEEFCSRKCLLIFLKKKKWLKVGN